MVEKKDGTVPVDYHKTIGHGLDNAFEEFRIG
jgi:hypothetical protein